MLVGVLVEKRDIGQSVRKFAGGRVVGMELVVVVVVEEERGASCGTQRVGDGAESLVVEVVVEVVVVVVVVVEVEECSRTLDKMVHTKEENS